MQVETRNSGLESLQFDKITDRIRALLGDLKLDPVVITQKIASLLHDGIKTSEIDELSANLCASLGAQSPDYLVLAGRLAVDNHQKSTKPSFLEVTKILSENKDCNGELAPLVSEELLSLSRKYEKECEEIIDHERDFKINFFGFKTLMKSYLLRLAEGEIIERPQHLFLRVAFGIHGDCLEKVKSTYEALSTGKYVHATPTLFHAGSKRPQMSSCFVLGTEDSVEGIFKTISDCAKISKWAGGIGLHISNIRARGSLIRKTGGHTEGILKMLKVYNDTARYINQCFTPDTIIYTDHGHKKIADVSLKDRVVTLDGTFKNILEVIEHHKEEKILSIRSTHSIEPVSCTKVHEIFALQGIQKMVNYSTLLDKLESKKIGPSFVSADTLRKGDFLVYPIPSDITDHKEYTPDICRFYGILLGDGHYTQKKGRTTWECGVTLGDTKETTINFVRKFLTNMKINYWEHPGTNCINIRWTYNKGNAIGVLTPELLYKEKEKLLHHSFLNLPKEKLKYLIRGLMETDGSLNNEVTFHSTSRSLIEGLRYILLRLGVPTSGYMKHTEIGKISSYKNIETKKLPYVLRIPEHTELSFLGITPSDKLKFFRHKNMLFSRIREISEIDYSGYVYDLNIESNHNYLTHMGIVHNSGKRHGSFAMYLEPWHADIFDFLEAKKNQGADEDRARDLFYALWIPDLFMKAVKENTDWYLMCPDECPGLTDVYGEDFELLYNSFVSQRRFRKKLPARKIWDAIIYSQLETGAPYMCYKDSVNEKSNQKNIGVIKSSNLCAEINLFSSATEYSVCNLASICLPSVLTKNNEIYERFGENPVIYLYSKEGCPYCKIAKNDLETFGLKFRTISKDDEESVKLFADNSLKTYPQIVVNDEIIGGCDSLWRYLCPKIDWEMLKGVAGEITENLNKVIDKNYYPTIETERSNKKHRPVGIGVQGLADVFVQMRLPFTSEDAKKINKEIFETIYFGALSSSMELSKKFGAYESFRGSPLSFGQFQFDLWEKSENLKYDWNLLRTNIIKYGVRNSTLIAIMPTASTSQIMGNNECCEPFTSNVYKRRTLAGEFTVINSVLIRYLENLGIWNEETRNRLLYDRGSVANLSGLPKNLKDVFKTVWEISQKDLITMASDRAPFVCQSQSHNLWFGEPSYAKLSAAHLYGWTSGLKTGSYYVRSRPAVNSQRFTMDPKVEEKMRLTKTVQEPDICESCSA